MALVAWYPLINDTKNYVIGDADLDMSGTINFVDGKIGKCLSFTGSASNYLYRDGFKMTDNFTWVCWVKLTVSSKKYQFIMSEGRDYGKFGFNILVYNNTNLVRVFYGNGTNYHLDIGTLELNTWYHIAVTVSSTDQVKSYLNGNLVATGSYQIPNYDESHDKFVIGKMSYDYQYTDMYFPFNGCINDVRIYDHCLSQKEIKEISKALVAHYPMSDVDGIIGGRNLLIKSSVEKSNNNYKVAEYTPSTPLVAGERYAITMCVTPAVNDGTIDLYLSQGYYPIATFIVKSTEKRVFTGSFIASYKSGMTPSDDINNAKIMCFRTPNDGTVTENTTIHWIKIEKGTKSKATPWTPAPEDGDILTLNDNTIYDVSGYSNHGTVTDSTCPTWSSNCVVGNGSYDFRDNKFISCGRGGMVKDEITVSIWGHLDNWAAYANEYFRIISCTEGGGWNFETNGTTGRISCGLCTGVSSGTYKNIISDMLWSDLSAGWHMFTFTYNGLVGKLYIDGVLIKEVTNYSTKTPIYYNPNNGIFIGAEAAVSLYSPDSNRFKGLINDCRIYATALSDSDIKELYNTRFSIDDKGNLYANEIIELGDNLADDMNQGFYENKFSNGLDSYIQGNCQVTMADHKIRIYRPANIDGSTTYDTWGGAKIHFIDSDGQPLLIKGRTYIILYNVEGKSSNRLNNHSFTNCMGWGGGGLSPAPSNVSNLYIPNHFNGEMECFYKFTINDDIYKVCTESYHTFIAGETYLSYRDFQIGFGYTNTGAEGTDIYISNIRLYDITSIPNVQGMTGDAILKCMDYSEVDGKARILTNATYKTNSLIEL